MKNSNDIFAYSAGYIDGDGCFYIGKYASKKQNIIVYEFSIQIVSVKKAVLDYFQTQFGGSMRLKPFKDRHRDAYCLTVKSKESINLAVNIAPYLVEKATQARIFINFTGAIMHNRFRTVDHSIISYREDLINLMREDRHMNNLITKQSIEDLKNKRLTVTPSDIDYPYLAGLIDAEGCFRIKKWKPKLRPNHVYTITVEIGNTKLPVLPWLIERFGGSVTYISPREGRRASATWTLSAAALHEILPKIRPFLVTKQEVCDKLIEFQRTILSNGGDRHSELFRALFERRREVRERIIQEVHEFNLKGSH